MTNLDYWQTLVGEQNPEDFLRTYGTADPDVGLERFLKDRGHFYGVLNQGDWATTFVAEKQYHVLTARVYLRSYLEETREDWQPALEARPPKVVRRYKPVYDFPITDTKESDSESDVQAVTEASEPVEAGEVSANPSASPAEEANNTPESAAAEARPEAVDETGSDSSPASEAPAMESDANIAETPEESQPTETESPDTEDAPESETTTPDTQGS